LTEFTKIIPITFDDLPKASFLNQIQQNFQHFKNPGGIAQYTTDKDSPRYMVLNNSKYGLVERAIKLNPFQTKQFAWVDFGIIGAIRDFDGFAEALQYSSQFDKLSVPYICPKNVHLDFRSFFGTNWFYCCAGYAQGSIYDWRQFISEYDKLFQRVLQEGYYSNEESFLGYLLVEKTDLFVPYYADYYNIFKNRINLTDDIGVAQMCLRETAGKPRLKFFHEDVKQRLAKMKQKE